MILNILVFNLETKYINNGIDWRMWKHTLCVLRA